jgi:hypothetical protein
MLDWVLTHHLESIELIGHLLDLLFLARLLDFDTICVPIDMSVSHRPSAKTRG